MGTALGAYGLLTVEMASTQRSASALAGSCIPSRTSRHACRTSNQPPIQNRRNSIRRRILIPIDFSKASRPALPYALALTAAVEGNLLLLHVVEGDPMPRYVAGEKPGMFASWVDFTGRRSQGACSPTIIRHDRCEEARWKLASRLPPGCSQRFRPLVSVGKAAEEIVRVAMDEQVDLILRGSQGQCRWRDKRQNHG
jgi:nucleotide-binding universal stress UspA family protein